MSKSIDVVIPSFRLDEQYLLPILQLIKPAGFEVNFYLIADNPNVQLTPRLLAESERDDVHIIVNQQNIGFSATRNKGIDAGFGHWILLLDDDVTPKNDLLIAYSNAISLTNDALGFVGVTYFPQVINAVTKALKINGVSTHFQLALHEPEMYWSATANIMLNRKLLASRRFLLELKKSTEDMELLFRNAFENNLQKYIAVPSAVVNHPWWDNGKMQTKRMFRYGAGAAEAARLYPLKLYTFYDFTNTTETLLLLALAAIPGAFLKLPVAIFLAAIIAQVLAEYLTNYYKAFKVGKTLDPVVALQMMWHKNVMEAGKLTLVLLNLHFIDFSKRIDGSFRKQNPQPYRLNRWKIIKLILFVIIFAITLYTCA
ncbi:glycosyltransferase family 2 protein [Mucilaginibacter achroorhodeus]|uniref:Glycosyltransferase family 2 protein n=1 Tax=Mucilaginibacter achroorhodeus TaxID=2599294 RepID=A0A563TX31_9SPHI|nr:glycosyltransferase family 2 protein [Mucilaginibacter achroorhodeus]TWR23928.1 glycosyltransferase family 2 protein [Mucilaginibacter achroorhodeus]